MLEPLLLEARVGLKRRYSKYSHNCYYMNYQINALKEANVHVAESPAKIGEIMKQVNTVIIA